MADIYLVEKIAVVLINLVSFWLMFIVFTDNKKKKLNQWFVAMTFFVALWINFAFLGYSTDNIQIALFFYRLNWCSVALFLICSFYFYFVYFLEFKNRFRVLKHFVLFVGIILAVFSIFTNFIIKEVVIQPWGVEIIFGSGNILFNIYSVFIGVIIIISLIKKYFKFHDRARKIRIKYFLLGTFLFVLFNIIFNIIFPLISKSVVYQHFGDYSAIFLLGFTAYAITKHELMGIKTLITQVLIVIISLILFIDVILLSNNLTMQLLKSGILLAFLYFSRELVKSVRKEKKAREELEKTYKKINAYIEQLKKININLKEKNEDLESLLSLSNASSSGAEIDKNIQSMIDIIPVKLGHLKILGAIMVRYDEKNNKAYSYTVTQSKLLQKAIKILPREVLSDYHTPITPETPPSGIDNLTADSIVENKIKTGKVFADFIDPPVDRHTAQLMQKMMGAKSIASAPINVRGAKLGAIIFIFAKPLSKIKDRDLNLMRAFTQHLGVVLENLQFYEQTEKQIKALSVLNENLKMANVRLKELMEIKNEFLHITSHQLRTPLTTIRGMIAMWHDGEFDNLPEKEKKKMLKRIYVSSERLNNITNDMLDSLELEGGFMKFQFRRVSLRKIIKETVDIMRPNFDEKNLYLKFNDSADMPKIEVEPNYIRQVFINLIDNACKYTRKGGIDINIKKSGKYAEITIKDTGIGVSKSDQKKIFQKFTRGKRASIENASGSGLGLFIAKKIVNAHNGKIEFFSEGSGKGSVVKIFLPVKQE
jgi:signal transduction histidine kinase